MQEDNTVSMYAICLVVRLGLWSLADPGGWVGWGNGDMLSALTCEKQNKKDAAKHDGL